MTSVADPIAIVGIGCRLPGGADSPAALWRRLCERFDAIGPIPSDRFDADALFDARPATPGRIMSAWGGFLDGVEDFDADFFGISPREADRLDPQQRLLLETAWEALEDAGISRDAIAGSRTGVFVGVWIAELESRLYADPSNIDFHMTTGTGRYAASGRVSYFLDLLGPSVTVDTACSSSLVAVHLACQSLWSGECDLVLAGGANVILEPTVTIAYSQSRMMARDGRCKFGDAAADGYVRSDGAGVVALKRLSSAQADGDHIHAVIRGSAVTNDGRSGGFLATPGQAGQEEMLRQAYARAGVDPQTVQYVEAHGTGTAAGDPIELGALGAVVGRGRPPERPCLVGSIKSNVGHTEGAAGVSGLIKVALALEHGQIPPSLHVREVNPLVPWAELGLEVCTEPRQWLESDAPARAGISAFGITGTNAHVVLEAAPSVETPPNAGDDGPTLLALSANDPQALRDLAARYVPLLDNSDISINDLCASAATQRSHLAHRLAVVATDRHECRSAVAAFVDGDGHPRAMVGKLGVDQPRVVFVFPGQGSQWRGMARELLATERVFREAMDTCDRAIQAEAGWSPTAVLMSDDAADRFDEIDVIQPLLFAVQVSLAAQWRAWEIEPDVVVGHSMGEVAAAHVAGALSLADAVAVICRRSALMRRVRGQGAMAVVDLPVAETRIAIAGHEHELAIAVSNSPRSTVISGGPAAVEAVLARLEADDVFCRPVNVDVASHSPQMDPLLDDLRSALAGLAPQPSMVPFHSTVDGRLVDGELLDDEYWARNLRQPVLFGDVVDQIAAGHLTVFVEISPHPILLPAIEQVVRHGGHEGLTAASGRRDEGERTTMLAGLGTLFTSGVTPNWSAVLGRPRRYVHLPTYPWQRQRYWYEPRTRAPGASGGHPLLGHPLHPATEPRTCHWQSQLAGDGLAFLDDHVVRGAAILPAAGFIELALIAVEEACRGQLFEISALSLRETLPVDAARQRSIQITLENVGSDTMRVRVHSREPGIDAAGPWLLHAEGTLSRSTTSPGSATFSPDTIRARCREHFDHSDHLAAMSARGLDYGEAFRTVAECWVADGEVLGRVHVTAGSRDPTRGRIRLLDGCLQLALDAMPAATAGQTFLPVRIDHLQGWGLDTEGDVWCHAWALPSGADTTDCHMVVFDDDGARVVDAVVRFQRFGTATARLDELMYDLAWVSGESVPTSERPDTSGTWIVFARDGVGSDTAARLTVDGERCIVVRPGASLTWINEEEVEIDPSSVDHHRQVVERVLADDRSRLRGLVYAWCAAIPRGASDSIGAAELFGCLAPIALVQALTALGDDDRADRQQLTGTRLWLVTRGAQRVGAPIDVNAAQAVLWGTGRVIATEQPSMRCTMVDLDPTTNDEEALIDEVWRNSDSRQIALRSGDRCLPRLERSPRGGEALPARRLETDSFRLVAHEPGSLDSLRPHAMPRRAPGAGEIELRITASGVNFLDVLKAMGIYPGIDPTSEAALGAECAGEVVDVGADVRDFAVGDQVIAITPSYGGTSMLASHVTLPAAFAVTRPDDVSPEEACGLPVAYLTAYYALHVLARVRRGERVLIHSAAGGVGLAALQICRHLGAEVLATAGNDAKREYLRSLGIQHVFDSRTLAFADEVLAATAGRGVDVVLNALVGDAIPAGLSTLAPRGRFVELGKRDVYEHNRIDLALFTRNVSMFVVDLAALTEQDPSLMSELFREVMALVRDGRLGALPTTVAPITSAPEVFRVLAGAGHIGKLVLTSSGATWADAATVRPDGTYLIAGGLGALGLAVAERFVRNGARHLVLIGRSRPSATTARSVDSLRGSGADVRIVEADVTDLDDLRRGLVAVRETMPPVRGVVHAAGGLADATIAQMDAARLHTALGPKLAGGWNLHVASLDDPLDFFVLFSSVAAVLGLAGQSNYAAGNAYLDGLAHERRAAGRPATSIDWGPWSAIGLAAVSPDRGKRLADRGLGSIAPAEGLDALDLLLDRDRTHAIVMRLDADRWIASEPTSTSLLSDLVARRGETIEPGRSLRDRLLTTPAGARRRSALEDAVCAELAPVLRVPAERIDRHRPLKAMGLDSLMALELRNRLEAETGVTLSATVAWNYPTVVVLATHLAARMSVELDPADPAATTTVGTTDRGAAEQDEETSTASQEDLEAMLAAELEAVDRLLDANGRPS